MNQHLLVFIKVVELRSFSHAAEKLHMTQPAVSQYIQALERMMGTKLLDRSNKNVRLNKAGDIVYHHALEILGLYSRMRNLVEDLTNTASGDLSIGASYTFGEHILPHVIAKLRKRYPRIRPTITIGNTKEISDLVRNHQLDLGIVEGNFEKKRLTSEVLATDMMRVFMADQHPLSERSELTLNDLKEETWIVRERGSGTREAADRLFEALDFQPDNILEFGSTQLIKESVEAGLGIALLSTWATRKELSLGTLRVAPVAATPLERQFSIIAQSASLQTKAMEVFQEILKDDATDVYWRNQKN